MLNPNLKGSATNRAFVVIIFAAGFSSGPVHSEAVLLAILIYLWFHWTVARRAVKVADIAEPDNLKAFWNAIHLHVPRIIIHHRNPGFAGLSAMRACKIFKPSVAGHP